MLINLTVLKFEIETGFYVSNDYSYTAPKYSMTERSGQRKSPTSKVSYAAALSSDSNPEKQQLLCDRGKREMQDITVETLVMDDAVDDGAVAAVSMTTSDAVSHRGLKEAEDVFIDTGPVPPSQFKLQRMRSGDCSSADDHSHRSSSEEPPTPRPASGKVRHRSESPSRPSVPGKLPFFCGNPAVEVIHGILHMYKENQTTSIKDEVLRSEMICMLGVPASMSAHDILQFTAPVRPNIEYIRIIRNSTPNQYMVLIKFKDQTQADEFYKAFNGVPLNSLEPDLCHLIYVAKVEVQGSAEILGCSDAGLTELPTCPVCLERMDESVNGILTILCNHSFHDGCLFKWSDSTCPVCRYTQTPEQVADNSCFLCGHKEDLWICLICGHVGCGRYAQAHAFSHFEETQHTFAMQLGGNRVWDYVGDNYVHRLMQSKGDGKIVQFDGYTENDITDDKIDSVTLEYTYLLTSQLESQRLYFEEKMDFIEKSAVEKVAELETRLKLVSQECESTEGKLITVTREKQNLEKKNSQLSNKMTKITAELTDETEMNKSLMENQKKWQTKVFTLEKQLNETMIEKDKEIADIKEQLRDVMFYLEAQQKIGAESADVKQEIQEGQIIMGQPSTSQGKRSRKKR